MGDMSIKRFHKGAFYVADSLSLDIVPVYFYGIRQIMPKGSPLSNGGYIFIQIGKRFSHDDLSRIGNVADQAKMMRRHYIERLEAIHHEHASIAYLYPIVYDRFIYKGREIERAASHSLKSLINYDDVIRNHFDAKAFFIDDFVGRGELALLLALIYPNATIFCRCAVEDADAILLGAASDFVSNINVVSDPDFSPLMLPDIVSFALIPKVSTSSIDIFEDSIVIKI